MKHKVYKLVEKSVMIPTEWGEMTSTDIKIMEYHGEFSSMEEAIKYLNELKGESVKWECYKGEYTILPVFEI